MRTWLLLLISFAVKIFSFRFSLVLIFQSAISFPSLMIYAFLWFKSKPDYLCKCGTSRPTLHAEAPSVSPGKGNHASTAAPGLVPQAGAKGAAQWSGSHSLLANTRRDSKNKGYVIKKREFLVPSFQFPPENDVPIHFSVNSFGRNLT